MIPAQKNVRNIKLIVEFDGTDFHGWQRQLDLRTVQGVLEDTLQGLFGEPVKVIGCGRTDAGVHAWAYVCNFKTGTRLPEDRIREAACALLPKDIVVKHAEEVDPGFHSRFDATARRYIYQIALARTAVHRKLLHYTKYALDVDLMSRAAARLEGEHDFSSFAPVGLDNVVSPVCTVHYARLRRSGQTISFDVKADRFLYHMVRNIVGTLIEVGRGKIEPEQIDAILCKKDRTAAGPMAPARGLALAEVYYPG